jgi:hypothetical protein
MQLSVIYWALNWKGGGVAGGYNLCIKKRPSPTAHIITKMIIKEKLHFLSNYQLCHMMRPNNIQTDLFLHNKITF